MLCLCSKVSRCQEVAHKPRNNFKLSPSSKWSGGKNESYIGSHSFNVRQQLPRWLGPNSTIRTLCIQHGKTRVYRMLTFFFSLQTWAHTFYRPQLEADANTLLTEEDASMSYADRLLAGLIEAREMGRKRMAQFQDKSRKTYNARHREISFQAGDLVLV